MVVTQYTGYSSVSPNDPPTYANVGTSDGIADCQTMRKRIEQIRAQGTDAEIEVFNGLPMAMAWAQGQRQRDGLTGQSIFGNGIWNNSIAYGRANRIK